jgi:hypothetical protein
MMAAFLTGLREMEIREISEPELSSPQFRFSPSPLRLGLDYRLLGVMGSLTDDSPPATSTSGDCTPPPGALRCNPRGGKGEKGELVAHPVSAQDGACHVVGKEISIDCAPGTAADAGSTCDSAIGKLHGGSNVEGLRFVGS